jgi:hypothetical protein
MELQSFLRNLRACNKWLTQQQYKTLRGQAIAGDVLGACKGLEKILKNAEVTK